MNTTDLQHDLMTGDAMHSFYYCSKGNFVYRVDGFGSSKPTERSLQVAFVDRKGYEGKKGYLPIKAHLGDSLFEDSRAVA